jgi:periodic tryptophan protein 1
MSKPIITSLTWIKKNWARSIPVEYEVGEEPVKEYKKLKQKGHLTGGETIKETTLKLEKELDNLKINTEENLENVPTFCDEFKKFYKEGENKKEVESENIINVDTSKQVEEEYPEDFDDLSDDEQEDFTIHPTDTLIACTTAQEDFSNIEVYIFDEKNQSLYVHHDLILSAYPLCIEWLYSKNKEKCNYAIIGSFLPDIEIWNLDVQDALEPEIVLGNPNRQDSEKYYKNLKKKKNAHPYIHTDAVMSINVNPFNNSIIASGSADTKILFWDINKPDTAFKSYTEHGDKIQAVKWNKMEDNVLISGSFDKTMRLFDFRTESSCATFKIGADVESIDWSPLDKYLFLSSYEDGRIDLFDIRKLDTLFSFKAHKKATTSVTFSSKQEGLFASVSSDSHVKVWDSLNLSNLSGEPGPSLICDKFIKKTTVSCVLIIG